ncbi:MAG: bifunctional phosphopantothenoylcysteine decarboxylase/phosphopantothenate--cysteine ligase CoaBC [Salibacteraceae bacterium]
MLRGKKILIGITGSIAAYKSILLVRELVKLEAEVMVVCTPSALDFVTPLTLSTLSKNPVYTDFLINRQTGVWANHVELAKWADAVVVAPCSASTLSKLCTGQCDNLLLAVCLSASSPMVVAPAMDLDMYAHPTTQENIHKLKSRGVTVVDAGEGELASGLFGKGRMAEPEELIDHLSALFRAPSRLKGKKLLVTAGPTFEPIDPVRFIGNHSSGKMGYAIANEAHARGAGVVLVSGPVTCVEARSGIEMFKVTTADQMNEVVRQHFDGVDIVVMAAAVADFKPKTVSPKKIKKHANAPASIELVPNPDILAGIASRKRNQVVVGFALETDDEIANAKRKLTEKNLDMLVLNSLRDPGAGFGTETNKVTLLTSSEIKPLELKSKAEVAADILDEIEKII